MHTRSETAPRTFRGLVKVIELQSVSKHQMGGAPSVPPGRCYLVITQLIIKARVLLVLLSKAGAVLQEGGVISTSVTNSGLVHLISQGRATGEMNI